MTGEMPAETSEDFTEDGSPKKPYTLSVDASENGMAVKFYLCVRVSVACLTRDLLAAKDFVKQLTAFDPKDRPSADDCLSHPFITKVLPSPANHLLFYQLVADEN